MSDLLFGEEALQAYGRRLLEEAQRLHAMLPSLQQNALDNATAKGYMVALRKPDGTLYDSRVILPDGDIDSSKVVTLRIDPKTGMSVNACDLYAHLGEDEKEILRRMDTIEREAHLLSDIEFRRKVAREGYDPQYKFD